MLKLISTTFFRQIFAGFCQILTLIIIARTLNADGMGQYTLAILIPTILSQVLTFGLQSANIYSVGRKKIDEAEVLFVNLLTILIISTIGTVFCCIFIFLYADLFFSEIPIGLLYLASFSLIPLIFNTVLPSVFQASQKFFLFNLICIIQPLIILLITVCVVLYSDNLLNMMYGYTISNYLTLLFILILSLKFINIKKHSLRKFYKSFLGYSLRSHLSNIVTLLNYRSTLFILGFFTSPIYVGIYTVGLQLVEKLWLPSQAVSTIFLPKLANKINECNSSELAKSTLDVARRTSVFTFFISIIFVCVLPTFINLFFGVEYTKSILVAFLLLPGILAWTPSRILANDLAARGLADINLHNACWVLLINIALGLIFIPYLGIKGAAIATSIAYISDLLLRAYAFKKVTGVKVFRNLVPNTTDFKIVHNIFKGLRNVD